MPALKGTRTSLSYVQCFLYLVSSSIKVAIFHSTWLDTFWRILLLYSTIHQIPGTAVERVAKGQTETNVTGPSNKIE